MSVVILGGGGHGSDMLSVIESVMAGTAVAILDEGTVDPRRFVGRDVSICATAREVEQTLGTAAINFVAGVGYPESRRNFVARALEWGWCPLPAIVHPSTQVMAQSSFGEGTVVMGLSWVSPCVTLGLYVYVGYGAKIGHDVSVGDFTSVFPGVFLAGEVSVGSGCMIGANATVLPGVRIGDGAQVGAGAVVVGDVEANATVTGVPAATR